MKQMTTLQAVAYCLPTLDTKRADIAHWLDWLFAEGFLREQKDGLWSLTEEGVTSVAQRRKSLKS